MMTTLRFLPALVLLCSAGLVHAMPPPAARVNHAQVVLPDGRVMIAGGEHIDVLFALGSGAGPALTRRTAIFDPRATTWIDAGNLVRPRTDHAGIALPDGRVVVLGGGHDTIEPDPTVEEWDPARRRWRVVGRLAQARFGSTATLLADGRILVVGGASDGAGGDVPGGNVLRSVELWDPSSRRSVPAAPLPIALTEHAAVRLADGRVLVTGGTGWWGGAVPTTTMESRRAFLWEPRTGRWTEARPMSGARVGHAATLLRDGRVLIVGNRTDHSATACRPEDDACLAGSLRGDAAELFDPPTGAFALTGATNGPRLGDHQLATLPDGRVAVFGLVGLDCIATTVPQMIEAWDPRTGSWDDLGDARVTGQAGFRASLLPDGRVLLTGADMQPNRRGLTRAVASVELWDPSTARPHRPARVLDLPRAILE